MVIPTWFISLNLHYRVVCVTCSTYENLQEIVLLIDNTLLPPAYRHKYSYLKPHRFLAELYVENMCHSMPDLRVTSGTRHTRSKRNRMGTIAPLKSNSKLHTLRVCVCVCHSVCVYVYRHLCVHLVDKKRKLTKLISTLSQCWVLDRQLWLDWAPARVAFGRQASSTRAAARDPAS